MEERNTIDQRFDYKNKKRTLTEVIEKFDKFCKLTKPFYELLVNTSPSIQQRLQQRLLLREKNIGSVNKTLNDLIKCYEQPTKAYFDFGMENYKSNFTKDHSYDEVILFYFVLDKVDRYSSVLNFLSSEHFPLWWIERCLEFNPK